MPPVTKRTDDQRDVPVEYVLLCRGLLFLLLTDPRLALPRTPQMRGTTRNVMSGLGESCLNRLAACGVRFFSFLTGERELPTHPSWGGDLRIPERDVNSTYVISAIYNPLRGLSRGEAPPTQKKEKRKNGIGSASRCRRSRGTV